MYVFQSLLFMALTQDPKSKPREPPMTVYATSYDSANWVVRVHWEKTEDQTRLLFATRHYRWDELSPTDRAALMYALCDHFSRGRVELARKPYSGPPTAKEAADLREALGKFTHQFYHVPHIPPPPGTNPTWDWAGL